MEKLKKKYRINEQTILALNNCVCLCYGGCPCGDPYGDDYSSFDTISRDAKGIINTGNYLPAS